MTTDTMSTTARLHGWIEGWQCARLREDGSLPPTQEVREAVMLAGFPDGLIDVVLQRFPFIEVQR